VSHHYVDGAPGEEQGGDPARRKVQKIKASKAKKQQ